MSGIAAIIDFEGRPIDPSLIEFMTETMAFRAPDGIQQWVSPNVALGHCMMRTTPESLTEMQPLCNEDESVVLVFDGFLTNWEELSAELVAKGAKLRTSSDAELILRAYETWGEKYLQHLDGEFAIVIWDTIRSTVSCARDHAGLRPLFYRWCGRRLFVASDIAPLKQTAEEPLDLNPVLLAEFMSFNWVSEDETVWKSIRRLKPAHELIANPAGKKFRQYWSLKLGVRISHKSDREYQEHYLDVFSDCIRRASRSHKPVGFEVSGGLDSSANLAIAETLRKEGKLLAPGLRAYTLRASPGSEADEFAYAQAATSHLGIPLSSAPLFTPQLAWFEDRTRQDCDLPPFPNLASMSGLTRLMAADGCRVGINGAGGDQWLDGTLSYYHEQLRAADFAGVWDSLTSDAAENGIGKTSFWLARYGIYPFLPSRLRAELRKMRKLHELRPKHFYWLQPDLRNSLLERVKERLRVTERSEPDYYKVGKLGSPVVTHNFDVFSRQCARAGVEPRSPMFSRSFVDFSAATPERTRRRGKLRKVCHREAMIGILPPTVLDRTSKADFSFLFNRLLGALQTRCSPIYHNGIMTELIDPKGVDRLFARHQDEQIDENWMWEIWGLYGACLLSDKDV